MARESVAISSLINDLKRYQALSVVEDIYLIRDMQEALDMLLSSVNPPWTLKKSTLRVFDDVLIYPVADDHNELAILDNDEDNYASRARFAKKTIRDFIEDPDRRNDVSDIWDDLGHKYLGVRYNTKTKSETVDTRDTLGNHTVDGANTVAAESVIYKEGNGSVRVTVPADADVLIENTPSTITDTEYRRKYYFVSVYLDAVPTSLELRRGLDNANYLHTTVTTQFSGQSLEADAWNLVAFDLNTATEEGTMGTTFSYEAVKINGATAGTYYIDASYVRGWELLEYWYYSLYIVIASGGTEPSRRTLLTSDEQVELDAELVFDKDFITYMKAYAGHTAANDLENKTLISRFARLLAKSESKLMERFPSLRQEDQETYWRFGTDFTHPTSYYDGDMA